MTTMTTATTILEQLGGRRFQVMTGAKNFVGSENSLQFKLPGAGGFCRNGINWVRITLEPSDTYKVEFFKSRGLNLKLISEFSDVYCDMLQSVFTNETGLDTHL